MDFIKTTLNQVNTQENTLYDFIYTFGFTGLFTIISIISSIFVIGVYLIDFEGLSNKIIELIKTIASGIFTGAVLALVTTLILYFNEKKKYMEKVIQYSRIYYQTLQNTIQDCKNVLTS